MSDPRFARLKTDPRFRKRRRQQNKVVIDERFKDIFDTSKKKSSKNGQGALVDKYGRPLSKTHEQDNLRRFYRLEDESEEPKTIIDYARGEVTLESSDEEEDEQAVADNSDEDDDVVTLGVDSSHKKSALNEEEAEIDLDEDNFADLDAQAAAYAQEQPEEESKGDTEHTRRLAVVNIDWDHVRAAHLFRIFSSLLSPTAPPYVPPAVRDTTTEKKGKHGQAVSKASLVVRGKVLHVAIYPSEFGKERLAREEKEGPPAEIFGRKDDVDEDVNEKNIYDVGDENVYDEDALRKYQLERLRYYYAIVTLDSVDAASHIYEELDGTELERSANVFDLSFVPDDMAFDDECRDEATEDTSQSNKGLDFVTDALRHSKVKLTWDEDDAERNQLTRRTLSKKEIEEADFRAYIASGSESESEGEQKSSKKGSSSRDKLRALLLSGNNEELPEGWGKDDNADDVDMEVTFTPGLTETNDGHDETTLEKYQRKLREKKKKRKEEAKAAKESQGTDKEPKKAKDEFFDNSSDSSEGEQDIDEPSSSRRRKSEKKRNEEPKERIVSTKEELELLVAPDQAEKQVKHFDMKAVLKVEKGGKKKLKGKKGKKPSDGDGEGLQEDFVIDTKDDRFKAIHEDHTFAIDPSHPQFKKTKGMAALLEERSKRQKQKRPVGEELKSSKSNSGGDRNLQSLVESVKRKSEAMSGRGHGKRLKL